MYIHTRILVDGRRPFSTYFFLLKKTSIMPNGIQQKGISPQEQRA